MKKVVLLSATNTDYEPRMQFAEKYFHDRGYETTIILSDFSHINKKKIETFNNKFKYIKTIPYSKNLSVMRIISHRNFSKKVYYELCKIKPDIIFAEMPPNFIGKYIAKYKRKYGAEIIFDICDLWPESLPIEKLKGPLKLPLNIWRNLRDKNIVEADRIIVECNLFREVLCSVTKNVKTATIYLSKHDNFKLNDVLIDAEKINVCYLGSINNIIDIETIVKILSEINKYKVVNVHIIGSGEQKHKFIQALEDSNISVEYYGILFNESDKHKIMSQCNFGLNIMKSGIHVGMTMKSLDYFSEGLPILNNIQYDTKDMVENHRIGFNVDNEDIVNLAKSIISMEKNDFIKMRERTNAVFKQYFTPDVFNKMFDDLMK
ncbi:glycosyltransferase [Clostridium fungisolvens]|uniref:Glycosyltransferase n=1 Tax=Clostridium fungisolvens TaxID=1604897 RepID=A0A6V8SBY6_9CLOT|nr:glycosyltransferase [Clostridium fungisolvens]GFP74216.1 hypothetical protein bsdtw1_00261 [Clostridium fungisolvens]